MPRARLWMALALCAGACTFDRSPNATDLLPASGSDAGTDASAASPDGAPDMDGASHDAAPDAEPDAAEPPDEPCSGGCSEPTPVCLSPSGTCVECARDRHCTDGDRPACDPERHACVACTKDEHCGDDTPRCATDARACVQCLAHTDCGEESPTPRCDVEHNRCVACIDDADCSGETPACDLDEQRCVECTADAHCADPARPQCEAGTCVPCTSSDACAGREDTICDTAEASPTYGACVQCTIADESPCGGNVCDPLANRCTDRPLASKRTCESCIADSECIEQHRCVELEFKQQPLPGGACLKQFSAGCQRPYAAAPIRRASRSGAPPEDYCGIDEEQTTCRAIAALIADAECATGQDAECGADGALCRTVNGVANRCTYACGASSQCPAGFQCGADYCGGTNAAHN